MVTSPGANSSLDLSKQNTITWTSVSSDPASFNIVLVDATTSNTKVVGQNVQTSSGSFNVSAQTGVIPGLDYTFNFQRTGNDQGILAQSGRFIVVAQDSSSTTLASASSTASSATFSGSSSG